MKTILFAILLLIHPVHVSLTGIEYDDVNRTWSVFVKVWSDDLEADMKLGRSDGNPLSGNPEERFFLYLSDRIIIMEDETPVQMELVSATVDGLEHRFALRAKGKGEADSVTVVNRIMARLHEDQANMLLISLDGIEEGYRFTATDTMKSYKVK